MTWLWITNLAVLWGAEFDAGLPREREIEAGHGAAERPHMDMRDAHISGEAPKDSNT